MKQDAAKLVLTSPACTKVGEKVALSRRIEKHWRFVHLIVHAQYLPAALLTMNRLIGWATIVSGNTIDPSTS